MQAVVWLVGVAGMSAFCTFEIVLQGVEQLSALVQNIFEITSLPVRSAHSMAGRTIASTRDAHRRRRSSSSGSRTGGSGGGFLDATQKAHFVAATRPTLLYALMAISNLSFFFGAILHPHDGDAAENHNEEEDEVEEKMKDGIIDTCDAATTGGTPAPKKEKDVRRRQATRLVALYESLALTTAGLLFSGDTEAAVEATRIISNICFTPAGANWVEAHRLDEVLVLFLGHEDRRIVYNCAGALVNLTAATTCRVVVDPDLLSLLLQYTRHWTKGAEETTPSTTTSSSSSSVTETSRIREKGDDREGEDACVQGMGEEKGKKKTPRGEKKKGCPTTEMEKKKGSAAPNGKMHSSASAALREKSYFEQINGVVQRLLHNISGLLLVKDANDKESPQNT